MTSDLNTFFKLQSTVFGWILKKESKEHLKALKNDFLHHCEWKNLPITHSSIETRSLLSASGNAWAVFYTEIDKKYNKKRFWYTDIGLKNDQSDIIVSISISYAMNTEDLSAERDEPKPTIPTIVRYLLRENKVYSGRKDFRLIEKPVQFDTVGMGKLIAEFIQSHERRYPLIVFNGNSDQLITEANNLSRDLAGKCQVVVVATNSDLGEELREYLNKDYWISLGYFRVFFPFRHQYNSTERHRWYNVCDNDYSSQRNGIVHGLLRNHILQEKNAIESVRDIDRHITVEKLSKLKDKTPQHEKELHEFFRLFEDLEKERDHAKEEAASYATEVDALDNQLRESKSYCMNLQERLEAAKSRQASEIAKLLPISPKSLIEVAQQAEQLFSLLEIT